MTQNFQMHVKNSTSTAMHVLDGNVTYMYLHVNTCIYLFSDLLVVENAIEPPVSHKQCSNDGSYP